MSNEELTVVCVVLGLVVYYLALKDMMNWGRYDRLAEKIEKNRSEIREEYPKTWGLELDVKYMKQDIKRLEDKCREMRK